MLCLHAQKHSTCHSCVCWFLKIERIVNTTTTATTKTLSYINIHVTKPKQKQNVCNYIRSTAKLACILYHDRNLNEMCDQVGQQRDRKLNAHLLTC